MISPKGSRSQKELINYILFGMAVASLYAVLEYLASVDTNYPPQVVPLLIRANLAGASIMASVYYFEFYSKNWLKNKAFLLLVLNKSISYTLIITFILGIINGIWEIIERDFTFWEGVIDYITDESYLVNLISILGAIAILISFRQINSLHRKGELWGFVTGKYHMPQEIKRIFCFIDLKGSTTIGEQLGHYQFGMFLKDYYSDITEAIRQSEAEIYQYIGDEIVLYWPYNRGLKNNNILHCFFLMKSIIESLKEKYIEKYGVYPQFKAGIHGGKVTVTWVGEIKKEIVYIGDVLNTTSRIQEYCKRLSKEFLISGELLELIEDLGEFKASFVEETALRGKEKTVKLYAIEMPSG